MLLPWIPTILENAPGVFELLSKIFGTLAIVPIVGPFFAMLAQMF